MGHYCEFGHSVGLSENSSYASSFPQFIGTDGTSNNWDYGGWHNNAYSGCHQQVYAAAISPGSGYNHVQRSCGNASVGSNDSDSTYWKVHAYQVPDHVQETCSTSFRTSDASDDCYWSVCTFPVSSTKPHVTQTQPSLHDGTVGYSLKASPKPEYHEMQVLKVSNPIPIENTLEGVPPEQQSQLCEKKKLSLEQQAFLKQKYDEAQDNLNQSEECHKRNNEKDIHTLCRKLLADLKHIQEERKTRELEAQRKHEEEEIHKELDHFLYNAFNLFEEEHVCEADIVELDVAYVLSYLKEVIYDGKLSLCHLNFGKWINLIRKEQEQILVRGITDIFSLQAINIAAAKTLMSTTENRGISQSDLRETLTERGRNDARNSIVSKTCQSWGLIPFQQECTIDAKLTIQWDPRQKNNREIALISLLHPIRIAVRLILLWDLGNYRSKIRTEWFLLQSNTTNVPPLLPWDPGDQEILLLIMLALNWHFLTLKAFQGSGEDTKQAVLLNNVNIPSCTLDMTTAMVVYMGSHKGIMMSDVSRVPPFVQSSSMKQIPAMILPGILGHVISGLICRRAMVYLKIQPYRQNAFGLRGSLKHRSKYYGPFKILESVGKIAYRLQLPDTAAIHPVFHISQLQGHVGKHDVPLPHVPLVTPDGKIKTEPFALLLLDERLIQRKKTPVKQWLVHWESLGPEDAT